MVLPNREHEITDFLGQFSNEESKSLYILFFLFLFSLCRCPSLRCYGHFCTHRWLFHLSWFQSMVR